jgi:hypothetical protein
MPRVLQIYKSRDLASCKVFLWLAVKTGDGQLTSLVAIECNIRWLVRLATNKHMSPISYKRSVVGPMVTETFGQGPP